MGKCSLKRILSLGLALVTAVALCPALPAAAETAAPATCPHCGGELSALTYTPWNGTVEYVDGDAHYKLTADTETDYIVIDGDENLVLDLNGYSLSAKESKRVFRVGETGTFTLLDSSENKTGKLIGNDISACGDVTDGRGGTIYVKGTANILGGTITGGKAARGGNVYITTVGILNFYGGTITGGTVAGDNFYGGNIYLLGKLNIYGGTVENGTSQDHGGNISASSGAAVTMYDGTVSGGITAGGATEDGTAFTGNGGNLYLTGIGTTFHMYGGTITGGQSQTNSGGNVYITSAAQFYMYGGVIDNGCANAYGNNIAVSSYKTVDGVKHYSTFYFLGGSVCDADEEGCERDLHCTSGKTYLYNGYLEAEGVDPASFLAPCACLNADENGVTVWHYGDCTDCLFAGSKALVTEHTGSHTYEAGAEKYSFACTVCGNALYDENAVALVNGTLYAQLDAAIANTPESGTLMLTKDVSAVEVAVSGITLDLNGFTLTAEAFTSAASGNVIDTVGTGKLVSDSITLSENNTYLPFTFEGGLCFSPVDFTQWLERVDENTTKVRFYFTQRAADVLLDDAIREGSTEIDVQIRLTWTDAAGVKQDKTYLFGSELLQKYAQKWNSRVFVTTIAGVEDISDLTCTYQVTSKASSGVTVSAVTLKNVASIGEKLTWDAINAFPIKRSDMTVEEMRELCVDFFNYSKTALWTPDESVAYVRNKKGANDSMSQGTVYGGLPYVGSSGGSVYRLMDYIDEATGLVDMKKAIPALGTKDRLAVSDLKYFGNQCANGAYAGWGRVMNSASYNSTSIIVPKKGYVFLGDVEFDRTITAWSAAYNTKMVCQDNGEQVMYAAYALLQKADGMVYYTSAGHVVMAVTDAHVEYLPDGAIDGSKSYVYITHQAQSWKSGENEAGDSYKYKSDVSEKKTFASLYGSNYIPFTFQEFLGTDPIEVTEASLVGSDGTAYITGEVNETTRIFTGVQTEDTLSWSELFSSKITCNYGIADAYIIVYDDDGNELYRHAVRSSGSGKKSLKLTESGDMVTTWETRPLFSGRTYNVKVEVQLYTGERPTIFAGQLVI